MFVHYKKLLKDVFYMSFEFSKDGKTLIVKDDPVFTEERLKGVETLRYEGGSIVKEISLPNLKTIQLDVNAYSGNFKSGCIKTTNRDSVKVVGKGSDNKAVERMLNRIPR